MSGYEFNPDWEDEGIRGGNVPEGDFGDPNESFGYEHSAPENPRAFQSIDSPGPDEMAVVEAYTGQAPPGQLEQFDHSDDWQQYVEQTPHEAYRDAVTQAGEEFEGAMAREMMADYEQYAEVTGVDADTLYDLVSQKVEQGYKEALAMGANPADVQRNLQDPSYERNVRRLALAEIQNELAYLQIAGNAMRQSGLDR